MNECDVIYFFQQLSNRTVRSVEEKKRKTVLSDSRTAAITLSVSMCVQNRKIKSNFHLKILPASFRYESIDRDKRLFD